MIILKNLIPARTPRFRVVKIKKGLAIYKQSRSPFWYVRVFMPFEGRRNQVTSTKTESEREARKIAEDFYVECLIKKRALSGDQTLGSRAAKDMRYSFASVAEAFLEERLRRSGNDPKQLRNFHDVRKLICAKNGLKAYFGKKDITEIGTGTIRDYLVFAEEQSLKGTLSASTRAKHLITLNLVLKSAYERGLIASLPLMPKQRKIDNPRPWLDASEYAQLWNKAQSIAKKARKDGDDSKANKYEELHDFVVFMVNTFLRPSEWANLRHRHVKVFETSDTPHIEITVSDGKTRPRTVYSMPQAVEVYKRIAARTGQSRENYLFKLQYFNRKTALQKMRADFDALLKEADLELDGFGKKRTMYSLRHSSIMFRLLLGDNVDYQTLVKNAGTSIDQLHRFYASHLDPRMNLGNLQSFKATT